MGDRGHAPAQQLARPCAARRGEAAVGASGGDPPVGMRACWNGSWSGAIASRPWPGCSGMAAAQVGMG